MRNIMWRQLYATLLLGQAIAMPVEEPDFDVTDLSFIKNMAAIGDSYAAGIGAGHKLGNVFQAFESQSDYACSRYDRSFPYLVNQDERLGDSKNRKFQFQACSGALTKDVLDKQIPLVEKEQDAILLSVGKSDLKCTRTPDGIDSSFPLGGNDAELVNVLNQCIFQWLALDSKQVLIANVETSRRLKGLGEWIAGIDWEVYSRGCQGQLDVSMKIIESDDFGKRLDDVLEAAKGKLAKDGMIYFTGYGKFFGEELTHECDEVSWSTWIYNIGDNWQKDAKLDFFSRDRMNRLVDLMNEKLEAAAKRAGSKVRFINYDKYIGQLRGRFCEPGVDEHARKNDKRPGLMFFELNGWDIFDTTLWKRSEGEELVNGTFEADMNIMAEITRLADPEAKFIYEDMVEKDSAPVSETGLIEGGQIGPQNKALFEGLAIPRPLPDVYARVFHPQVLLHGLIANYVVFEMMNDNQRRHGFPEYPTELSITTCPKPPKEDEPWCLYGGSPRGERVPKEYCQCGKDYATTYAVKEGSDNPCPYTKPPGPTLVFSTAPAATATEEPPKPTATEGLDCKERYLPDARRDTDNGHITSLNRDAIFDKAIPDFCSSLKGDRITILEKIYGAGGTPDGDDDKQKQRIVLAAKTAEREGDCKDFDNKLNEEDCTHALRTITDGCDTDTTTAKQGGGYNYKCVLWYVDGLGGPDIFKLHIHQEFKDEKSTFE
ncbi:hypothetical protein FQN49_000227 [Arthroderma sp. PD_2]|nr:hypothetical protein FQN49_000227 [Arthroderma sp. PD_2]